MALICGVLLHELVPPYPMAWLIIALSSAIAMALARSAGVGGACGIITFITLGLAVAQSSHYRFAADHIALYATDQPRLAQMRVRLDAAPRLLRVPDIGRPRDPKMAAIVEVVAVKTWAGWREASGTTLLQLHMPDPRLKAGQTLELFGHLERPGPAVNPGQFDFANYYRGQRVLVSFSASGPENVVILHDDGPGALARIRAFSRDRVMAGFDGQQTEEAALLKALLLGERDQAMSDAAELFRASGTSHHLAVSGLHISIVGGTVFALFRIFGAGPRTSVLSGCITIAIYALLAEAAPPVVRAVILAGAMGTGLLFGRRGAGVQLLSGAAIAQLLVAPLDLYRAGFQLSFVAVLGLMLFGEGVHRALSAVAESDSNTLRRQRDHPLVRIGHWLDSRMLRALAAAIVAWLAAMPLVALHFGQFNSWAIPASLVAGPPVFISLLGGVLKLIASTLFPELSPLWADLAAIPITWMRTAVGWFAAMPGADVPLPTPSIWLAVVFYVAIVLAWWSMPSRSPHLMRRMPGTIWLARLPLFLATAALFILPLGTGVARLDDEPPLRITLLAVGAGQCAVIETPGAGVTLIDAGSSSLGRPVESCIAPFLREAGFMTIDRLLISHANFDHYNAAATLAESYEVGEIVVAESFDDDAAPQPAGQRLLDDLTRFNVPPRTVRAGDVIPLGRQTRLRVLWPLADVGELDANDSSLVIRLEHDSPAGEFRLLFTGDIQEVAMRQLLALEADSPGLLKADVLIAPHHGSTESSTRAFIDAVDPDFVLSSNGRSLARKQTKLADLVGGRPLLRTHDRGALTVSVSDEGFTVGTFLEDGRRTLSYPE